MIMKKFYFILTAAASIALASCTNDEIVGQGPGTDKEISEAINFGGGFKALTRADKVGADAAALLGNNFVVYGAKSATTTAADKFAATKVFDHYNVNFVLNTAGSTESNTSDWEYVNQTVHSHATGITAQTIKYWDLATAEYDFIAYSSGTATELGSGDPTSGKLVVSAITPATAKTSAYTVAGATADDLAKFYIADIKTVLKANYRSEVVFNFRSLTSKVRIGLYETVPGYSVKDVKFYSADETVGSGTPYLYGGSTAFNDKGTFTVSYPTIGYANKDNTDYNKAHVSFAAASEGTSALKTFGALTPKVALTDDAASGDYLGRTAPAASMTPYLSVLPNESGVILNMKCDYTLVATDGSAEEIKVTGASAQVPTVYAKWLPNYAYTYIFKISDKSNGTTGIPGDPAGLYPITFDATVITPEESDTYKQETITIVETPSITTYQKGSLGNNEYVAGTIYVMVQNGATLANDLNTKGQLYTVNTTGMNSNTVLSETAVAEALNIGATTVGTTTTGRNGIALTTAESNTAITSIVGPDGNNITVTAKTAASFTASTGTYAYVYTVSDADDTFLTTAVTVAADAVSDATGYYTDMACTTPATLTGTYLAAGTYYQKVTNKNTTYGVKIIKVQ